MKIVALVVTYNRKELLCECLDALLAQSRKLDKIVVVDNASTDNTQELFSESGKYYINQIEYKILNFNSGGAGGFYQGIKYCSNQADWIWIMDDDTIPETDALDNLCNSMQELSCETIAFLASKVVGPENEAMNLPTIDTRPSSNGYSDWYRHLESGIVKIRTATFVSILLNVDAVKKEGYPIPWYFLWGDDSEYTLRLTQNYGSGFFVGKSKVVHKRFNARQISVWEESNYKRLEMYYYFVRNLLYNERKYGSKLGVLKNILLLELKCIRCLFNQKTQYKWKRVVIVNRGIGAFIFNKYDRDLEKRITFI